VCERVLVSLQQCYLSLKVDISVVITCKICSKMVAEDVFMTEDDILTG